jgi:hypothetical protein
MKANIRFNATLRTRSFWYLWIVAISLTSRDSAPSAVPQPNPLLPPLSETAQAKNEEVQRAGAFSDAEKQILIRAQDMPVDKLVEMISVYERLANQGMLDALVRHLASRAPKHPETQRLLGLVETHEEVRDPGYIDRVIDKLKAGFKLTDPEADSVSAYVAATAKEGDAEESIYLLEKLEKTNFPPGQFNPYHAGLAYAYRAGRRYDESLAILESVIKDKRYSEPTRLEAEHTIPEVRLDKRIYTARQEAKMDFARVLDLSGEILAEGKSYPPAVDFRVECLTNAGRPQEAVELLQGMKTDWPAASFLFLPSLGYSQLAAKDFDKAKASFLEVSTDPSFLPKTREEAVAMLGKIEIAKVIQQGTDALTRRDYKRAIEVLDRVEHDFPPCDEITSYKAAVLARTDHADEALALLESRKNAAAAGGKVFQLQDSVADVHLVRHDFAKARAAYDEVLRKPNVEPLLRLMATKGMESVKKEETIFNGYINLQWGQNKQASAKLEEVRRAAPADADVKLYGADVLIATGREQEAIAELEDLKNTRFSGGSFPGESQLGLAHYRLGELEAAYAAYSIAAEDQAYSQQEKLDLLEAVRSKRELLALTSNNLGVEGHFLSETEGESFILEQSYESRWWHEFRAILKAREFFLKTNASSIIGAKDVTHEEGLLSLQRKFKKNWFAEVTGGASEKGDFIYGARFGQFFNSAFGWSLGYTGNARATDSLPLQSLNGRADKINLDIAARIAPRINTNFSALYQWVSQDGQRLGRGHTLNGSVDVTLVTETVRRPEISAGWFGSYSRYNTANADPALKSKVDTFMNGNAGLQGAPVNGLDALLDPRSHREGLQVTLRKHFGKETDVYLQAGFYYELDDRKLNGIGALGVQHYIGDSALLFAELRYDTSGRGGSTGGGVWEANMGARISF